METDAHNQADTIVFALERAMQNSAWRQLRVEEQTEIILARDRLTSVKQGNDVAEIHQAIVALDLATRRYAEQMMETAVRNAIRGQI
jgi:hypothetical protein